MSNVNRAYAKVMRSAVLWGLSATAAFYIIVTGGVAGQLLGEGTQAFLARYCAGHLIEYVEVAMFFIGMAALLIKRRDIVEQFAGLKESILGPVPAGGQSADDCDSLEARLDAAPARQQQSYLVRRLREALACIRRNGSAENLDQELKYLAESDDARAHGGFGLVRVIIWAIPILGFLGTVIGITDAIQFKADSPVMRYLPGGGSGTASILARLPKGSYTPGSSCGGGRHTRFKSGKSDREGHQDLPRRVAAEISSS